MKVLGEFLPPGCRGQISNRLNQVRWEFEGLDLPPESLDDVAGLAVGMVNFCLFEALHREDEGKGMASTEHARTPPAHLLRSLLERSWGLPSWAVARNHRPTRPLDKDRERALSRPSRPDGQ